MKGHDAARKAWFLDRDGTIIVDRHYLSDPEQVELLEGAAQALANMMQLTDIPHELIQMVPYLTTLVGLGVYSYAGLKKRQKLAGK